MPYYKKAIDRGDDSDLSKLASCYFNMGINYPEAVELCKKAIKNDKVLRNAAYSACILGKYHINGMKNNETGLAYYILAVALYNDIENHIEDLNQAVENVKNYKYLIDFFVKFCKKRKIRCHSTKNKKINLILKCIGLKTKDLVFIE